jgi:hypothetical protein
MLIACALVFTLQYTGDQAISFVRLRRKGSIQTRGQVQFVQDFATHLHHSKILFAHLGMPLGVSALSSSSASSGASSVAPAPLADRRYTLHEAMQRQHKLLFGKEEKNLANVPELIFRICARLTELAQDLADDKAKYVHGVVGCDGVHEPKPFVLAQVCQPRRQGAATGCCR